MHTLISKSKIGYAGMIVYCEGKTVCLCKDSTANVVKTAWAVHGNTTEPTEDDVYDIMRKWMIHWQSEYSPTEWAAISGFATV
jgi:hypothetical protein